MKTTLKMVSSSPGPMVTPVGTLQDSAENSWWKTIRTCEKTEKGWEEIWLTGAEMGAGESRSSDQVGSLLSELRGRRSWRHVKPA